MNVTVILKSGKEVTFPTTRFKVYYDTVKLEDGTDAQDENGNVISNGKLQFLDYAKADRKRKLQFVDYSEIAAVWTEPDKGEA